MQRRPDGFAQRLPCSLRVPGTWGLWGQVGPLWSLVSLASLVGPGEQVEFHGETVGHCVVETFTGGAEELALRSFGVRSRHLEFEVDAVSAIVAEGTLHVLADLAWHYNSPSAVQRPESTRPESEESDSESMTVTNSSVADGPSRMTTEDVPLPLEST